MMRAGLNDLIVILCGLATSAATAAALATLEIRAHFALSAFTFWFVIPVGAFVSGGFASSGYALGAKLLNHKLHRFFIVNIVGVSIATYFLLNYMVYANLLVNGQHVSDIFSFTHYLDTVIENRKMSFIGVGSLGKTGFLGFALVAIQLVGFAAGGLMVYRNVASDLYCEYCRRYLKITLAKSGYNSLSAEVGGVYQDAKAALQSGDSAGAVDLVSKLSTTPSGTLQLNLRLGQCPKCAAEYYHLGMSFEDGKKWHPHPDFQTHGVLRQPSDALPMALPHQPEKIGRARIALTLGTPMIALAAIFIFRPAGLADSSSAFMEGTRYLVGKDVPRDEARAAELYRKAARAGNTLAMAGLGELYREGKGVPRDPGAARSWLEKAANGGNALAMFELALMYNAGQGIPRDPKQAAYWYDKAAAKGNADAMLNLGGLYFSGSGVPRNDQKARELFEKAVLAGRVAAMHNLGLLDLRESPPNYLCAIVRFNQAAARGYTKSMTMLGGMYLKGKGAPRDYLKARAWFTEAANQGDPLAMLELGVMMIAGQGGVRDAATGRTWIASSAAAGNPLAAGTLQKLDGAGKPVAGRR
jgi:TPR repeat protein